MKKTNSNTAFWLKQVLVILLIAGGGFTLERVVNRDTSGATNATGDVATEDKFSSMYANFRLSSRVPRPTNTSDFIIELPTPTDSLSQRLVNMNLPYQAKPGDWGGMHKFRAFRQGATLQESLSLHTEQEGFHLIWDLNQDFIIKNRFETQGDLLDSARVIKSSIQPNFSADILLLTCAKQRAIVLTTVPVSELNNQCEITPR